MRDIKFRGKRVDNGEWVYGWLCQSFRASFIAPYAARRSYDGKTKQCDIGYFYEVLSETVSQYTGLKDKNKKEYWEDSIVRGIKCEYNDANTIGKVYYNEHHAAYWVSDDKTFNMPLGNANWWEVIGNIHEHPELMEQAQ